MGSHLETQLIDQEKAFVKHVFDNVLAPRTYHSVLVTQRQSSLPCKWAVSAGKVLDGVA